MDQVLNEMEIEVEDNADSAPRTVHKDEKKRDKKKLKGNSEAHDVAEKESKKKKRKDGEPEVSGEITRKTKKRKTAVE